MRSTVKTFPVTWDGVDYKLAFTMLTLDILSEDFGVELDQIVGGSEDPNSSVGRRRALQIMYALLASDVEHGEEFHASNTFRQFQANLTFDRISELADIISNVITAALPSQEETVATKGKPRVRRVSKSE